MKARARVDHRTRVGEQRSARTQTRIVAAALEVFARRGPDAPVIDEFVKAAGIARGTFYNHFDSVEELLRATSEWTTRAIVTDIEQAVAQIDEPALRFGVALRMFFARAQTDPVWCRFVARVWRLGGQEMPERDLRAAVHSGQFRVRGIEAAHDVLFGSIREALRRIGEARVPPSFGDQVAELCLRALQANPRLIAAALSYELPALGRTRVGPA